MAGFRQWIHERDLFFFDFDGLLVNTESFHYRAYQKMCLDRGFVLPWDFTKYCDIAHRGSDNLQKAIYELFPKLQELNWSILYREKQKAVLDIMGHESVPLMPGVERVLLFLEEKKARRCVVTHSPLQLIQAVRKHNAVLETIPHWVTREQYDQPKPHPDAYLKAAELYGKPGDRIIGFEDTLRGWGALHAAALEGIVVSPLLTEEMKKFLKEKGVSYYSSFEELFE